jgi:peptide deformylase
LIKQIITYPTPPSLQFSAPVRFVNDEIKGIIQDLKDTIEANSLDGLAAFQIGSAYNIVVVKKDDGSFLVMLNPNIVMMDGEIRVKEKTAYFPGLSAKVNRYEKISIVYEDEAMKSQVLKADGEFGVLLQRKIDYTFGSSFINKLDPNERALFQQKLEFGEDAAQIETCPTVFKRDYIIKAINILLIAMVLLLGASFFLSEDVNMLSYQTYLAVSVVVLNIVYFFYAQYEGREYISCSGCQIGNIIGTVAISLLRVSVLMLLSYFLI